MFVCHLFRSAVLSVMLLWSFGVYAETACTSMAEVTGKIDPNCQQTNMRGSWWAIPGKLIPPQMIEHFQEDAIALQVPGYWSEQDVKVNADYPRGLVTLWTEIELSGPNERGEDLAIWPGRHSSAIRIYVNNGQGAWSLTYDSLSAFIQKSDQIVEKLPNAGAAGLLNNGPSFQLPKLYPGSQIVLQLYVDDFRTEGISQPPQVGLKDDLYANIMHRNFWHFLFLGASLIVTVFAASQAIFSDNRRLLNIFLVIISAGIGIRLMVTGSLLPYILPNLTVHHHFYLGWMSFLFLLSVFISAQVFMLPRVFKQHPTVKNILLLLSALPVILIASIPLVSLHQFLYLGHTLRSFYILATMCYIVFLAWKVWTKHREHVLQLLGFLIILISGIYDAHLYTKNTSPYIETFAMAVFLFVTLYAIYLGWEHVRLLGEEKRLTLSLKALNESLEKQVRIRTQDLQSANAQLALAATTDALTDLPNRRSFDHEIENMIGQANRQGQALCLAIADIDRFKSVNDTFGHSFGDKVLKAVANYLKSHLRTTDFVSRIGGEEFAIILPATNLTSANSLLNKLCEGVTALQVEGAGNKQFSISIGLAELHEGLSIEELYQSADKALYQAKENGRARVECV